MGKGIDLARDIAPEHAQAIDDMKDQLLIVLFNRLGGKVKIPVREIDATGNFTVSMQLNGDHSAFIFEVQKKH